MSDSLNIYGFGSYFHRATSCPRDIDILIIHECIDLDSINFAIRCKRMVADVLPTAHCTMLSASEERELNFIEQSSAVLLGRIVGSDVAPQLAQLAKGLSAELQHQPIPPSAKADGVDADGVVGLRDDFGEPAFSMAQLG